MRRAAIRIYAWLTVGALASSAAYAADSPCSAPAELRRIDLAAGAQLELDLPESPFAHLLEERGIDLAISVDGAAAQELNIRPPRMGMTAIAGSAHRIVLRARAGQGAGAAWLWLHCLDAARSEHIARLEALYRDQLELGSAAASAALPELETRIATPGDQWSRTWWTHSRAQALQIAGRYQEAGIAFDQARNAWLEIGDRARAGVALMAAGEAASRSGDYKGADRMAEAAIRLLDDGPIFFLLRSQASKCVTQGRRGELRAAIACEAAIAQRYRDLDERSEAAVRDVSIANQWLMLGDVTAAGRHLGLAQRDWALLAPAVRARLLLATGTLALQQAELGRAIQHYREASSAFEALANSWDQAIVDLKLARFARLSGAVAEERA